MVLHSQKPRIWGYGRPNSQVKISLADRKGSFVQVPTDQDGKWIATIPQDNLAYGDSAIIAQDACEKKSLENIKIGEVWLCSGQSNMQWEAKNSAEYADILKDIANPEIQKNLRLLRIPKTFSTSPRSELEKTDAEGGNTWVQPSQTSIPLFSAVCYHMGSMLQKKLKRPIGLISSAYGGSITEAWILSSHLDKAFHTVVTDKPKLSSSYLYNAMISPLVPMKLSGAVWYQGEANRYAAKDNVTVLSSLIESWQVLFKDKALPFHLVQLANYGPKQVALAGKAVAAADIKSSFANERQAQYIVEQRYAKVYSIPAIDNTTKAEADASDIHPRHKKPIGQRLARSIISRTYFGTGFSLPEWRFHHSEVINKKVRIPIYISSWVTMPKVGTTLKGFALKGATGSLVHADSATVVRVNLEKRWMYVDVYSKSVPAPVEVRFAWAQNPVFDFYTKEFADPLTPICIRKAATSWLLCSPVNLK